VSDWNGFGDAMTAGIAIMCVVSAVTGWVVIEGVICLVKWIVTHVRFVN
jgi:hypothetical protein